MSKTRLEAFTPYLMNRVLARYNLGIEEALRSEGISTVQMRTLAVLHDAGAQTVNDLAVLTVTKQSSLSKTLDLMQAAGLIRREAGETDSRVRMIHLTEAGLAAYRRAWPAMERMQDILLADLLPDERLLLNGLMARILRSIRHHDI